MNKRKQYWIKASPKHLKVNPTDHDKTLISLAFIEIINDLKVKSVPNVPDKNHHYLIDIYSKWHRNYFYLCEKFKAEYPERIVDEFETKFVRLEYKGANCFDFSYFRHIGVWHVVAKSITIEECKEQIVSNPNFQPIPYNLLTN